MKFVEEEGVAGSRFMKDLQVSNIFGPNSPGTYNFTHVGYKSVNIISTTPSYIKTGNAERNIDNTTEGRKFSI
jgi:hypothetical protein